MSAKVGLAIIRVLLQWRLMLRSALFALLVCLLVMAVAAVTLKGTTVARFFITFKFPGVDDDRYPNGTPFSIEQITQPAVLIDLYNKLGLAGRGLTLEERAVSLLMAACGPDLNRIADERC